jgi:hypothetical protein
VITVAMSAMGLYSMVATLLLSRYVFGVDLPFEHPVAFGFAVVATVVSIGAMGFLLAVSFVRYRTAWALGNLLEYGSSHNPAHPHLEPALDHEEPRFLAAAEAAAAAPFEGVAGV